MGVLRGFKKYFRRRPPILMRDAGPSKQWLMRNDPQYRAQVLGTAPQQLPPRQPPVPQQEAMTAQQSDAVPAPEGMIGRLRARRPEQAPPPRPAGPPRMAGTFEGRSLTREPTVPMQSMVTRLDQPMRMTPEQIAERGAEDPDWMPQSGPLPAPLDRPMQPVTREMLVEMMTPEPERLQPAGGSMPYSVEGPGTAPITLDEPPEPGPDMRTVFGAIPNMQPGAAEMLASLPQNQAMRLLPRFIQKPQEEEAPFNERVQQARALARARAEGHAEGKPPRPEPPAKPLVRQEAIGRARHVLEQPSQDRSRTIARLQNLAHRGDRDAITVLNEMRRMIAKHSADEDAPPLATDLAAYLAPPDLSAR